jgi:hypothetical protein
MDESGYIQASLMEMLFAFGTLISDPIINRAIRSKIELDNQLVALGHAKSLALRDTELEVKIITYAKS